MTLSAEGCFIKHWKSVGTGTDLRRAKFTPTSHSHHLHDLNQPRHPVTADCVASCRDLHYAGLRSPLLPSSCFFSGTMPFTLSTGTMLKTSWEPGDVGVSSQLSCRTKPAGGIQGHFWFPDTPARFRHWCP